MIWESYPEYDEETSRDMAHDFPDRSELERKDIFYEWNADGLQYVKEELNRRLEEPILVIADLGLWDGRRTGDREIPSGNLADCLSPEVVYVTWYVDDKGDLRCEDIHHDGTNRYLYREWLSGADEKEKEALLSKIYRGEPYSEKELSRVTRPLGRDIAECFGWIPSRGNLTPVRDLGAR